MSQMLVQYWHHNALGSLPSMTCFVQNIWSTQYDFVPLKRPDQPAHSPLPDHMLYICQAATARSLTHPSFVVCPIDGADQGIVQIIGVGDFPFCGLQYCVYQETEVDWLGTLRTTFGDKAADTARIVGRYRPWVMSSIIHLLAHDSPDISGTPQDWVKEKLELLNEWRDLFIDGRFGRRECAAPAR